MYAAKRANKYNILAHFDGAQVRLNTTNSITAIATHIPSASLLVKVLIEMIATIKKASASRIRLSIFTNFFCFLLFSSV
jgi:hypothetical protein